MTGVQTCALPISKKSSAGSSKISYPNYSSGGRSSGSSRKPTSKNYISTPSYKPSESLSSSKPISYKSPSYVESKRPISKPSLYSSYIKPMPIIPLPKTKGYTLPKQSKTFITYGRRFGKFRPIAKARTQELAILKGKRWASNTLGVSFKVPKTRARQLKGFRTKQTAEGNIYIEKKGRRLKKRGYSLEIPEIMKYKKSKSKRKKKLKGGKKYNVKEKN